MNRRWLRPLVVLTVLALAAVACGGDDSGGPKNGKPIKIGTVGPFSGQIIQYPEVPDALQAAVKAINDRGGLGGRRLEIVSCDDKFNTNEAAACARKLAEDPEIVALVGVSTAFKEAVNPIISASGLADIGPVPGSTDYVSDNVFLLAGGLFVAFTGSGIYVLRNGYKRPILIRSDLQQADEIEKSMAATLAQGKLSFAGIQKISQESVDVSAPVARALRAKPDIVLLSLAEPQNSKVVQAVYQTSPATPIVTHCAQFTEELLSQLGPAAENLRLVAQFPPAHERTIPLLKRFNEELEESGVSKRNELALNAWLGVRLFADVAKGLPTINRESVRAALKALKGYEQPGLTPPLDFTAQAKIPQLKNLLTTTTVSFQVVKDSKCVTDPKNPQLIDILTGQPFGG